MKKVLVTIAMGMLAASAFAQGTLVFASGGANVRYTGGATLVTANQAQVQFAWAPVGASYTPWTATMTAAEWAAANPAWATVGNPANITPTPGRFSGGTLTVAGATPAGAIIQGVVIGWTGVGAADFLAGYSLALAQAEGATTHQFGVTAPFTVDTANPANALETAGAIATSTTSPYTGLTLTSIVIPEPSSFALAGLGAAALLIFRRRK